MKDVQLDEMIASGRILDMAYNNAPKVSFQLVRQTRGRLYFLGSDGWIYYVEYAE